MKKKLLIFDLDGTLLNTLEDLKDAVNHALETFHYKAKSIKFIRLAIGNGVQTLIARCLPQGFYNPEYEKVLEEFKRHYSENYNKKTKRYKNVLNTLQKLRKNGYLLAVATNKLNEIANDLINEYYPDLFDIVVGDQEGLKKKPEPDMVDYIVNQLHISKEETLYIGDTNVDYEVSKSSNVDVCLVSYGYRLKEELLSYRYNVPIIDDMKEIIKITPLD